MPTLVGQLLIAGPLLDDPPFRRTVVAIAEHGPDGALGLVLNRPTPLLVTEVAEPLAGLVDPDAVVHIGGPVQPDAIVVVADFAEPERASSLIVGSVGFLPPTVDGLEVLGKLNRVRVYAGYAGWAPGQLEDELADDAWLVEPSQPGDLFSDTPLLLWSSTLRRRGGADALLATLPLDPRVN